MISLLEKLAAKRKNRNKAIYFDSTIWEMMYYQDTVFKTLIARYGMTRNRKKFEKQLCEYLTERGAKVYEGSAYMIYYREDEALYQKYIKLSEKENQPIVPKEFFYELYPITVHAHLLLEKED